MSDKKLNIPEWFQLDELNILDLVVNNDNDDLGTLFAGDNLEQSRPYKPTVRIYQVIKVDGKFEIEKKIGALSFNSKQEAIDFTTKVPSYSAIDLIYQIHKQKASIFI